MIVVYTGPIRLFLLFVMVVVCVFDCSFCLLTTCVGGGGGGGLER